MLKRLLPNQTALKTVQSISTCLKQHIVPLTTVLPGNLFDDLSAFGRAVGESRIVALGEATHGTREVFQLRHRLLEYLVKEKAFTVLAIEANWPESQLADGYVKYGYGTATAALASLYFWIYYTEEVLTLLEWMHDYNRAAKATLSFTSFDMQTSTVARDRVLTFVKQHDHLRFPEVLKAYSFLEKEDPDSRLRYAKNVARLLRGRRDRFVTTASSSAIRDVLQQSRIVEQAARLRTTQVGVGYRDQMMARNIRWLHETAYPGQKIVVWAHNGHISTALNGTVRPMGHWLRSAFGVSLYVLGFAINVGETRAVAMENGKSIGIADNLIPCSAPGTGTATLSAVNNPLFFLDLRQSTGQAASWLEKPHLFRSCGAVWDRSAPQTFMSCEVLSKSYDGLIFLDHTSATRGIK